MYIYIFIYGERESFSRRSALYSAIYSEKKIKQQCRARFSTATSTSTIHSNTGTEVDRVRMGSRSRSDHGPKKKCEVVGGRGVMREALQSILRFSNVSTSSSVPLVWQFDTRIL